MQATRQRDTACELEIRARLEALGLSFIVDSAPFPGTRRRADAVFPEARLAVYIDGCFWHGCPEHGTWPKANAAWWREKIERNRRRDADTNRLLANHDWTVVRIWEHETSVVAVESILDALANRESWQL
jgi:DNA mismatch endonuclease (patch repair protein)